MNQQDFTTKTEFFSEETGTSFRQNTNAPDVEAYFGGAAIRFNKNHPKSLWEDRAAEACGWPPRRLLDCLGYSEPIEILEKIGEILERPIQNLTVKDINFRDIKYVVYELRERYWEEDLLDSFPGGISPAGERNLRGCLYTTCGACPVRTFQIAFLLLFRRFFKVP